MYDIEPYTFSLGQGFEPGTSVSQGLKVRIGDVPVAAIRVLSSERIEVVTRGGRVGRNEAKKEAPGKPGR